MATVTIDGKVMDAYEAVEKARELWSRTMMVLYGRYGEPAGLTTQEFTEQTMRDLEALDLMIEHGGEVN